MERYVVLLRGVTPKGRNKVLMEPLRAALAKAGLRDVRTYIQSGNVLASSALARREVEALVRRTVRRTQGGDLEVMARTAGQFRRVLRRNPFAGADGRRMCVSFLARAPPRGPTARFRAIDFSPEDVRIVGDTVYSLYAPGQGPSKFDNAFFERRLGVASTTRNLNTVTRLGELLDEAR